MVVTRTRTVRAIDSIVHFVLDTKERDIPPKAYSVAKTACFDNVGTILAGAAQPVGRLITEYVAGNECAPQATVIGTGLRSSAAMAALGNGTMGHAMDYDDVGGWGHSTTSLLPALLAVGELVNASGKDVLTAYITAFEMGTALCRGGRYVQFESGLHSTPLFGTMASAAGSARLLGLSAEQTVMALGIASSEVSGVNRNSGSMTKPLHAGLACRNGVTAALLAKKGFTSYDEFLDCKGGFGDTFLGVRCYDMNDVAKRLGNPFMLPDLLCVKAWPCCYGNHSGLAAIFALLKENRVQYDDIARVDLYNQSYNSPVMRYPEPRTGLEGKFSIRYALACAILDGEVVINTFTDEKVKEPKVKKALEKVFTHVNARIQHGIPPDEEMNTNPVTITLKNGKELSRTAPLREIRGSARNPMSQEELVAKFRANASLVLTPRAVNQAVDLWLNLEQVDSISKALDAVAGRPAK